MKTTFITILIFYTNFLFSQNSEFIDYINSYKNLDSTSFQNFGDLFYRNSSKMTQYEAINYVYGGDTSKIRCHYKIFNMAKEKVEGYFSEILLPTKNFKINKNEYSIIGFTSFECKDPNKLVTNKLILQIIDENYTIKDSIIVFTGDDYDYSISGLLNPQNGKIFLYKYQKETGKRAYLYSVNPKTLKFQLLKEGYYSDYYQNFRDAIINLDWYTDFMK